MNQFEDLEPIYQRKLPMLIREKIKINKSKSSTSIEKINNEKFILDCVTISLAGNCNDPLSRVYYFNNTLDYAFTMNSSEYSCIIPSCQSETIIRLYAKKSDDFEEGEKMWKNLHL